jgi:hypothetical protein
MTFLPLTNAVKLPEPYKPPLKGWQAWLLLGLGFLMVLAALACLIGGFWQGAVSNDYAQGLWLWASALGWLWMAGRLVDYLDKRVA